MPNRWESEDALLEAMAAWEPLPDADDPRWDLDGDAAGVWAQFDLVQAAADAAGTHRWQRVAVAVFDHAANWDLHGAMQGIRHGPEKAFMDPDETALFAVGLEPLTSSHRTGTRYWVARGLGILRELSGLPSLLELLADPDHHVAAQAQQSIDMLAQAHPEARRHGSLSSRRRRTRRTGR